MAIDFQSTFGARNRNQGAQRQGGHTTSANDLPKANYWLNIGYLVQPLTAEDEARFVSLPVGIPLDTMEHLSTRSSNQTFAMFQAARNELLDQLVDAAKKLEPGQDYVIACEGTDLAIQIRRVNAEQAEPSVGADNPFIRRVVQAAA